MEKLIITNRENTLFYQKDGVLTTKREEAKIFKSEKVAEQKSIKLQLQDNPVHWISTY